MAKVDFADLVRNLLRWVRGVPKMMRSVLEGIDLGWKMDIPGDGDLFADFPDSAGVGICHGGNVHVSGVKAQRCGAHKGEGREEGEEQGEQGGHGQLHCDRGKKGDGRWT